MEFCFHHGSQPGQFFLQPAPPGVRAFLHGKMGENPGETVDISGGSRYVQPHFCKINQLTKASGKGGFSSLIGSGQNKKTFLGSKVHIVADNLLRS